MQHAQGARPDPDHGYCTDDVARALQVDLLHQRELGWEAVEPSAARNLEFLVQAFADSSGRFRNFRRSDGAWLETPGSEDANARALHALGEAIVSAPVSAVRTNAIALFERALPTASQVSSLRPRAAVLLACDAAVRGGMHGEVLEVFQRVSDELRSAFETCGATSDWPWPEAVVTYENELPEKALIIGGQRLDRARMVQAGLRVLDWLIDAQTTKDGHLSTVGNAGWWPRDGQKARFDQQPISATALLLAADTAYAVTGATRYKDAMEVAYAWFTGRNDAHAWIAEPGSGACCDGIGPAGVSENQGAESTLMWLIAVEHIRIMRTASHEAVRHHRGMGAPAC
ncbi:MAG: hypothetical protein ACC726_08500 [Chloroflexota bacterium]